MNRTNIFMERKAGKGGKWGEGRLQELNGQGAGSGPTSSSGRGAI